MAHPVPEPGETLDRLAGDWWIFQLERGHRYNTDDVLTAWTALAELPRAERILDLGCGVGSIGLLALMQLPRQARLWAIEVQRRSCRLMRKTIALNRLEDRVQVICADLRMPPLASEARFELITANPPYVTPGSGGVSPHPQRAAARIELHGDVFDYCRAAARHLAADGRFVLCHAARDPRPERALAASGLTLLSRRDVVFREGKDAAIAVFVAGWAGERRDHPVHCIRKADGKRTMAHHQVRVSMWMEE